MVGGPFVFNFGKKIYSGSYKISQENVGSKGRPHLFHDSHRGWLKYSALEMSKKNLFLGSGLDSFRIRPDNQGSRTDSHDAYFGIMAELGIIGFVFFVIFYSFIVFRLIKKIKYHNHDSYDYSCLIFLISLFISYFFINFEYTPITWILTSICLNRTEYNR